MEGFKIPIDNRKEIVTYLKDEFHKSQKIATINLLST